MRSKGGTPPMQAVAFSAGSLAMGASSFVTLTILARYGHTGELSVASAVLALALVLSVLPGAVQLRAAALPAGGAGPSAVPWCAMALLHAALLCAAPLLALLFAMPAAAVAVTVGQNVPTLLLSERRGTLIGRRRFGVVGANFAVEAVCRLGGGIVLGLAWSGTGIAVSLLIATLVPLAALRGLGSEPRAPELVGGGVAEATVTRFGHVTAALGALTLLSLLDIILAPRILGTIAADRFDLAALPAKAIFIAFNAVGWLAVPAARRSSQGWRALKPVLVILGAGLVSSALLLAMRPVVATLLGKPSAGLVLTAILAGAMTVAAATATCVKIAVARGSARPWAPLAVGIGAVAGVALAHPDATQLALAVFGAQLLALLASLAIVARPVPEPVSPQLLAAGRNADVYAYGVGVVRRHYRGEVSAEREAAIMDYALAMGYPVPRVHWAEGSDLVMDQALGPTMRADLIRRPWRLRRHARTLALLHNRLHVIAAPVWLERSVGAGNSLLHLDLHPGNIILTPSGPVVVDWADAGRGHPAADVAYSWALMSGARLSGGRVRRGVAGLGLRLFVRVFLRHFDRDLVTAQLPLAAARRLADPELRTEQQRRIVELLRREGVKAAAEPWLQTSMNGPPAGHAGLP